MRDFSESRIMVEDPDKMTGPRREWYLMKQQEIMTRYKTSKRSSHNHGGSKSDQTDPDLHTDPDLQTDAELQSNQTNANWDEE
ncbi:hypothetical protein DFH28DRAFT_944467 [Melampsora americana]|nr:hypothetical protein DFH28DRAFT_944467 [Melampsora americana]